MADGNEDLSSELLGIQLLSDSEIEEDDTGTSGAAPAEKADRTAQSEEAFQAVKRSYRVKVENGEIWRTIKLPLGPGAAPKPQAQALLHAVEELYFFRRYGEGAAFARRVLGGGGGSDDVAARGGEPLPPSSAFLDEDTRKMLRYYEARCVQKQEETEREGGVERERERERGREGEKGG